MNIFKKISLVNKVLKLIKDLKKHFDNNIIADKVKQKVENIINAVKELGDVIPEFKQEIYEIIEVVKKDLKLK
jgi:non-homologous end joining protein Ku